MHQILSVTKLPTDVGSHVWRYLDVAKLLDLLQSSHLHFSRADCLGDSFEGSWPAGALKRKQTQYADSEATFKWINENYQKSTYVNCWHVCEHESAAMWSLYLSRSDGVAIRSTVRRLMDAVKSAKEDVILSMVRYIDYASDDFEELLRTDCLAPFVHKRLIFEHEKELRAIVSMPFRASGSVPGLKVNVDIPTLVESIYISPSHPSGS